MFYAVATLSTFAALIHLWVMPEHFAEWWGYGVLFLIDVPQVHLRRIHLLRTLVNKSTKRRRAGV
jgi:hypothetical protein